MKLKFIKSKRKDQSIAFICKNNRIWIKKGFAESIDFVKGESWTIAIDEEENPIKTIYFQKAKTVDHNAEWKLGMQGNTWHFNIKYIINLLEITPPIRCKIEQVNTDEITGFKITLP